MSVPLCKLMLDSELVKGEVVVRVRSSLPIEGIDVILGNNLAGERVWSVEFPRGFLCVCSNAFYEPWQPGHCAG